MIVSFARPQGAHSRAGCPFLDDRRGKLRNPRNAHIFSACTGKKEPYSSNQLVSQFASFSAVFGAVMCACSALSSANSRSNTQPWFVGVTTALIASRPTPASRKARKTACCFWCFARTGSRNTCPAPDKAPAFPPRAALRPKRRPPFAPAPLREGCKPQYDVEKEVRAVPLPPAASP